MGTSGRLRLEILAGGAIVLLGLWAGIALLVVQAHRQALDSALANGRNLARSLAEYQDSSVRAIDPFLRHQKNFSTFQTSPFFPGDGTGRVITSFSFRALSSSA